MLITFHTFRSILVASLAFTAPFLSAGAAEPIRIVFQNGRAVDIAAVAQQGEKLVITSSADGFMQGQSFGLETADHVFGDKPAEINPAIALLLMGKPTDALKLLEPIVAAQRVTARIPGNFWLEAARAALVAYANVGASTKCTELGKEISDATPDSGSDPFVSLGKALLIPGSAKLSEREVAFSDLTTDNLPADVCAYASIFRAHLLKSVRRNPDAAAAAKQEQEILEAYLAVPCLFPAGGMILNGVAELEASAILTTLGRREEAVALLNSSIRHTTGTLVAVEAHKRLESLK
jgi:hypothetical protein